MMLLHLRYGAVLSCLFFCCTTQLGVEQKYVPPVGSIIVTETNGLTGSILLDHQPTGRNSPDTLENVSVGTHTIQLMSDTCRRSFPDSQRVFVKKDQYSRAEFELQETDCAKITVIPSLDSAMVSINGFMVGPGPLTKNWPWGTMIISAQLGNFLSTDTIVTVPANDSLTVHLTLAARKFTLIEDFSSTHCPGCPAATYAVEDFLDENPSLQRYTNEVVFHSLLSVNDDPFYLACSADQNKRFNLYHPASLPAVYVNGAFVSTDNKTLLKDTLRLFVTAALAQQPVAGLFFSQLTLVDTLQASATLNIKAMNGNSLSDYLVSVALIEEYSKYNSPNGQTEFKAIFRGFAPAANGVAIPAGDTAKVPFTFDISKYWRGGLRIVGFIQSKTTKAVAQSFGIHLNMAKEQRYATFDY